MDSILTVKVAIAVDVGMGIWGNGKFGEVDIWALGR
jgi:hypothetical protein